MAANFGKTWWGNEWLKSLTHIDYENRIPRGAAYARKGNVTSVRISRNEIKAKVSGSRRTPYTVTIVIPPFFEEEVSAFVDALTLKPAVISRLMKRELDPEVMKIAEACGLNIFPKKWTDMKMLCNCPDWAVPCKHIAAVIYMLSREIDNNPFLVFEMHNLDLLKELRKRGMTQEDSDKGIMVPEFKTLVKPVRKKDLRKEKPEFRRIGFARLKNRLEPLLMLLPDSPTFCPESNFKETYSDILKRISKEAGRFFAGRHSADRLARSCEYEMQLDEDSEISLVLNDEMQWSEAEELTAALLRINQDFLPDYDAGVVAAHQTLFFALHLIEKGLLYPQIVRLASQEYAIRWLPATIDPIVRECLEALDDLIPDDMISVNLSKNKTPKYISDKAEWLTSFFLTQLVANLSVVYYKTLWTGLFFSRKSYAFDKVGETEMPGAVKSWTDYCNITFPDCRPVLKVTEQQDGFYLDAGIEERETGNTVGLYDVLHDSSYNASRLDILRMFSFLSTMLPEINGYMNSGAEAPIAYTMSSFTPFLLDVVPAMQLLDIRLLLPKSLSNLIKPKASIHLKVKSDSKSAFGLQDLFSFSWQVAVGDELIDAKEFDRLKTKSGQLIKFKESYVYLDPESVLKLSRFLKQGETLSSSELMQAAILGEYDSSPITMTQEVKSLIEELTSAEDVPLPKNLNAELRPYQERGYSWMYRNMKIGFGSVLADDMGLGKTLQSIALLEKVKEEGGLEEKKALLVVPTGLLANWVSEISRFAPSLSVSLYHGQQRNLKNFSGDIMLTTYGVLRSDALKLKKMSWRIMIIDEAQNIKNHETAQSKAIHGIQADTHIALSGTPVENRLSEFWSIMDYANKGYLDTLKKFKETYANPIQLDNDEDCAARFRKITAPFMMRRMKTDKSIISDLPDKVEQNDYVKLTGEQAALYQSTLQSAMAEIEGIETTDHESLFKRQGLVLQMILALKQICNHPAQFLKNGDFRPELSGKVELLDELVGSIVNSNEKVLIFTQFKEMGDMLVKFLSSSLGREPLFYHGGCTIARRREMVERFQNNKNDKVFVLTLKSAGTGLNLTAASHVIHYDLWWNPAVEAQATDRAYRIGQNNNVIVHRFISKGTFEEKIDEMIQQKKHLADMTVASGESWIGKLSNSELRELFE